MRKVIYNKQTLDDSLFIPFTFERYLESKGAEFVDKDNIPISMIYHINRVTLNYHCSTKFEPPMVWIKLIGDEEDIGVVEKMILDEEKSGDFVEKERKRQ